MKDKNISYGPLTQIEIKLIANLLEMASEEFGNHGCNDFNLIQDGGLSKNEAIKLNKKMNHWNGSPEDCDDDEHLQCTCHVEKIQNILERNK